MRCLQAAHRKDTASDPTTVTDAATARWLVVVLQERPSLSMSFPPCYMHGSALSSAPSGCTVLGCAGCGRGVLFFDLLEHRFRETYRLCAFDL